MNLNGCGDWFVFDTRTRAWSTGKLTEKAGGTYRDSRACGVVAFVSDLLVLGNWSSGADTYLFRERRALAATDYIDTFSDGTTAGVSASLGFQYQVPEMDGAVHWQQATLHFEGGELSWRPVPTGVSAVWRDIADSQSGPTLAANTDRIWRAEVPTTHRRGNRLRLTISHTASEFFGLIGVSQLVRVGSRFLGRGTG